MLSAHAILSPLPLLQVARVSLADVAARGAPRDDAGIAGACPLSVAWISAASIFEIDLAHRLLLSPEFRMPLSRVASPFAASCFLPG